MGQFQEQTGNREVGTDQYLMGQFPRTNWPEGGTDESLGQHGEVQVLFIIQE